MADLKSPTLIYLKGFLFLCLGLLAAGLLLARAGDWTVAVLLAISIWAFCRAYYFAFYVIEHYVDPGYHFAGLGSFVRYLWSRPSHVTPNGIEEADGATEAVVDEMEHNKVHRPST